MNVITGNNFVQTEIFEYIYNYCVKINTFLLTSILNRPVKSIFA